MPATRYFHPERVKRWVKAALGVFAAAFLSAVLTSWSTYKLTERLNNQSALQQQYLLALQQFTQTGSAMDASVAKLSDAIVDHGGVEAAKADVRRAIEDHAGVAPALEPVVGRANLNAYMVGVGTLRNLVDETDDARTAMKASQARFDVMYNRTVIAGEAKKHIYQ